MPLFGWFSFPSHPFFSHPIVCCAHACAAPSPCSALPTPPFLSPFPLPSVNPCGSDPTTGRGGGPPTQPPAPFYFFLCATTGGSPRRSPRQPWPHAGNEAERCETGARGGFWGSWGPHFGGQAWQKSRPLPSGHEGGGHAASVCTLRSSLCYVWGKSLHFIHSPPHPFSPSPSCCSLCP